MCFACLVPFFYEAKCIFFVLLARHSIYFCLIRPIIVCFVDQEVYYLFQ